MDETEIEKKLKEMKVQPPDKAAKGRASTESWLRLQEFSQNELQSHSLKKYPYRRGLVHNGALVRVASFLLVIGVSFGFLSYMVTQSSRSGGGDASRETSRIGSGQLTQYPAGVRTSIIRMILGGVNPTILEFNDPDNFNLCSGAPATFDRCVFHPQGGGATYVRAPGEVMADGNAGTWLFSGDNEIENIGETITGPRSSALTADLIAFLPGIAEGICTQINDELGIGGDIEETGIMFAPANLMISTNADMNATEVESAMNGDGGSIGGTAASLAGQPFGCFKQGGKNVYYHVLIER